MTDARAIRVFVSSTFRDMQAERDELVKRVFPRLRRRCQERGVARSEVDLRWGVTEEQASEGAVLPICLAEIERTPAAMRLATVVGRACRDPPRPATAPEWYAGTVLFVPPGPGNTLNHRSGRVDWT